ncbi:MAG: flagellar hook-basal body protein [bacterium]
MVKGIDTAAQGMMSIIMQNDINANNLANINTAGFKQSLAVFKNNYEGSVNRINTVGGYQQYGEKLGTLSLGSSVDASVIDLTQGSLKQTGNNMDLAIQGKGFFTVKMPDGTEAYTRNGSFVKNKDGFISDMNGNLLMGQKGPISLANAGNTNTAVDVSQFKVDAGGNVLYNKQIVDKLKIADFKDVNSLQQYGTSLFKTTQTSIMPTPANNFQISQGALEGSNANAIECMINSMHGERTYESLSKVIQTSDKSIQKTINDVGRVKR